MKSTDPILCVGLELRLIEETPFTFNSFALVGDKATCFELAPDHLLVRCSNTAIIRLTYSQVEVWENDTENSTDFTAQQAYDLAKEKRITDRTIDHELKVILEQVSYMASIRRFSFCIETDLANTLPHGVIPEVETQIQKLGYRVEKVSNGTLISWGHINESHE